MVSWNILDMWNCSTLEDWHRLALAHWHIGTGILFLASCTRVLDMYVPVRQFGIALTLGFGKGVM